MAAAPAPTTKTDREAYYREHGYWTSERLGWWVFDVAERTPDREFLVIGDLRLTYGEFAAWADVLAAHLVEAGVVRGDRVMIQLPNLAEALLGQVAAFRIGAVNVPVVPIYREHEMAHIVNDCKPRAVISIAENRGRRPAEELDGILEGATWGPVARFCVDLEEPRPGWRAFPGRDDRRPAVSLPDPLEPDRCCLMLYTSGTTSAPKGVELTGQGFVSNARSIRHTMSLSAKDVFFCASPLSHLAGFNAGVVWPASMGAKIVVMPVWNGAEAARIIERERCTFTTAASVFLHDLVAAHREGIGAGHPISVFMSGGAATVPDLIREAGEVGITALRGYGMTETGGGVSWVAPTEPLDIRAEYDGAVVPGSEIQAVDAERRPLPPGAEGELRIRGPQALIGYTDPALTREQLDEEGWFYTGDLGRVDARGLVRITGRTKDIINRAGEKFSARDIEELIQRHPAVDMAAVVGLPDPRLGEVVGAFVTLAAGQEWPGDAEMTAYLDRAKLAKQKIPTSWQVLPELPRTASGKIQKHELRHTNSTTNRRS
ncbi:class I adenylate-forming enzyme family protein [Streptomyces sp. NPDC088910]|uniref:class I adenylate-forming enzyme family protein n=1 Tax=Streptomyces sp. NPDC088910 TaxID=3365911 RepID=UPI00380DC028